MSVEPSITVDSEAGVIEEVLPGGAMWSRVLRRGQELTLTDLEGGASVAMLAYNAAQPLERYNMPDTLKGQHTFALTRGHALYSDMGRVLLAIVADDLGWHDTATGHGSAEHIHARYGSGSYAERRNARFRNTRDNFLVELAKYGLGLADLVPNVNLFTRIAVADEGELSYVADHSKAGASITLRAEMDCLVVLSATPHPLDPATEYAPAAVKLRLERVERAASEHPCRQSRPENERAYALTDAYFL